MKTANTSKLSVEKAFQFAEERHDAVNSTYDSYPYSVHLKMTFDICKKYKELIRNYDIAKCACVLHDTLSDTRTKYYELAKIFGSDVAETVFLLTEYRGRNRKESHCDAYYKQIANSTIATFVKLCDIIANVTYSIKSNNVYKYEMYKSEWLNVKSILMTNTYNLKLSKMFDDVDQLLTT